MIQHIQVNAFVSNAGSKVVNTKFLCIIIIVLVVLIVVIIKNGIVSEKVQLLCYSLGLTICWQFSNKTLCHVKCIFVSWFLFSLLHSSILLQVLNISNKTIQFPFGKLCTFCCIFHLRICNIILLLSSERQNTQQRLNEERNCYIVTDCKSFGSNENRYEKTLLKWEKEQQ